MPPVPPVTRWVPASLVAVRVPTRRTTLPMFSPPCSVRNASSYCVSMAKLRSGRLVTAPMPARSSSNERTPCIQSGSRAMSASIATAQYAVDGAEAAWRAKAQMLRLPISSRAPPSPSTASETGMKSSERLLSAACARPDPSNRAAPIANTEPSRELHVPSAPTSRSCACL